jgi:hypothetical protein
MKMRLMMAAIALCVAGVATAGTSRVDVDAIAQESGLTVRQVRMVLGTPSSFAEYRTSYRESERKLLRLYGRERLQDLAMRHRAEERLARVD